MKRLAALTALLVLASTASARPDASLTLEFSWNSGLNWDANVMTVPGETIWVRVLATIPATSYGFCMARFNVVSDNPANHWDVEGNDSIDLSVAKGLATDGRMSGFDFGTQTQQVFEAPGSVRIDAKGDTANLPQAGIACAQSLPGLLGPFFNTSRVVEIYRFAVTIVPEHEYFHTLQFRIADGLDNGSPSQIAALGVYASSDSTTPTYLDALGDTGSIYLVPSPSAPAVALAALLAGCRRRRTAARPFSAQ